MKRCFVVLPLLLCFFLTACGGSSVPSSTTASTQPSTGQATDAGGATPTPASSGPTVLHVNIGPLDKTVTDAATVQNLYTTALKLPAYPTSASISQSCLNDTGVIYHLDFLQDAAEVQRMNLDPGSCKILYFSQTDLRQASDTFLNLLKQTLQVHSLISN